MRRAPLFSILSLALLSLLIGCQQSGSEAITVPQLESQSTPADTSGVLGVWRLDLDGEAGALPTASLTPVREASALGDTYALDVSRYFQSGRCGDCFQVTSIGFDPNRDLAVRIRLKHPFAQPDLPVGPTGRLDLHLFDVAATLVGGTPATSFAGLGVTPADPVLLNPDGYSGTFDAPLERLLPTPGINIHPYKLFRVDETSGDYSVSNPNGFANVVQPTGYNVFPQGAEAEETFILRPPAWYPMIRFGSQFLFVVTASWAAPSDNGIGTTLGQRGNPIYFLPEANQKAAWRVNVTIPRNELAQGNATSSASLEINVSDWQYGALFDPAFPDPSRKDQVRLPSEPTEIRLELPGLLTEPLAIDPGTGGAGWPTRTYSIQLDNAIGATAGIYHGCVEVVDGLTAANGLAQDDPVPFGLGRLATYGFFDIEVAPFVNPGGFGPSTVVSTLTPWDVSGHDNYNAPELIAHGEALYLSYEGDEGFGVVARKLNATAPWQSNKVFQAGVDYWLDPTIGFDVDNGLLHALISAPIDYGLYDVTSATQGATWNPMFLLYNEENTMDQGMAITNGVAGLPAAIYNVYDLDLFAQLVDTSRFEGGNWIAGGSPSALKPVFDDGLVRLDQFPSIHRLDTGTLIATFTTNQRFIELDGIDYGFEPVCARSTDDGRTWKDWKFAHGYINNQQTDSMSTAIGGGDTIYVLEVWGTYGVRLHRSTNEGLGWSEVLLPTEAQYSPWGEAEVAAGPDDRVAVIWEGQESGDATQLFVVTSTNGGQAWSTPVECDDDPGNLFSVYNSSGAYTADGKLHVAFIDDRTFPNLWRVTSQD